VTDEYWLGDIPLSESELDFEGSALAQGLSGLNSERSGARIRLSLLPPCSHSLSSCSSRGQAYLRECVHSALTGIYLLEARF